MNLETMVFQFLAENTPGNSNETRRAYYTKLCYLMRFLGPEYDASAITRDALETFKLDLTTRNEKKRGNKTVKGKLSPFTIRTVLVTVRHMFSWATARGLIAENPIAGLRIPKEPPVQPKAVAENVAVRLIEAAAITGKAWERARNVAILYLFRDSGCRVGGIGTALLENLDLEVGRLYVTEKGNSGRYVFLSEQTIYAVRTWLEWRLTLDLYCSNLIVSKFGTPLTREGIYKMFVHMASIAGIQERHNPHSFRHAFARDAIEAGIDLSRLSQILGHASIDITNRYYSRFNDRELKTAHTKYTPVNGMPNIQALFEVQNDICTM